MPIAILTKALDYQNKTLFPHHKEGTRMKKGDRETVTEEIAETLFETGLFEIIEDGAPPKRSNIKITRQGLVKGGPDTEKSVEV